MASSSAIAAGRAFVEIFTKDDKLRSGLRAAQLSLRAFGGATMAAGGRLFKGLIGPTMAIGAMAIGALGLAGGVHLLGTAFEKAAEHETFGMQLEVLLGSSEAAKDKLAELTEFAAKTPFELPEVVKAAKVLQVMGGSSLASSKNLTMVGDTAALVGQDFERVAFWVAQAYSRLTSGRPTGMALMALQRMGAISGETRNKIEALGKAGKGAEAFAALQTALGRFSGGMQKLSGTTTGLLSTLKDSIGLTLGAFAEPLLEPLKSLMAAAIVFFDKLRPMAHNLGAKIASFINLFRMAIEQGRVGELLGLSLKVGFGVAVDFFVAGLSTVFNALLSASGSLWDAFFGIMVTIGAASFAALANAFGAKDLGAELQNFAAFSGSATAASLGEAFGAIKGAVTNGLNQGVKESDFTKKSRLEYKTLQDELRANAPSVVSPKKSAQVVRQVQAEVQSALSSVTGQGYGTFSAAVASRFGTSSGNELSKIAASSAEIADHTEESNDLLEESIAGQGVVG